MHLANCSIDSTINKEKCQKFTSSDIAEKMLDSVGYTGKLFGKKVLENSFGSGVFLEKIVSRYIESALGDGFSVFEICKGLSDDIYGFEIDPDLISQVLTKLNGITDSFDIPRVSWSFFCHDALSFCFYIKFDFIIGNPPYLNYKSIDEKTRKILRNSFVSCKTGKFDYCYAFIEKSYNCLSNNGRLILLIPANIYKNVFGEKLRKLIINDVCEIWEYPQQKIFGDTLTTSSILYIKNKSNLKTFKYHNETEKTDNIIIKKDLGEKWFFDEMKYNSLSKKVGDYFNVSISVATLLNKAYLVNPSIIIKNSLETDLLRKAASPRSLLLNKEESIIFPYFYKNKKVERLDEKVFLNTYPAIYCYLKKFYAELINRDKDKNANWFEYGRSQAIAHLNCRKLLLSTVITEKPAIYLLDEETIPYSGIYITEKGSEYSLEDVRVWLQSDSFCEYVKKVGTSINGRSRRITCNDIKNFEIGVEKNGKA